SAPLPAVAPAKPAVALSPAAKATPPSAPLAAAPAAPAVAPSPAKATPPSAPLPAVAPAKPAVALSPAAKATPPSAPLAAAPAPPAVAPSPAPKATPPSAPPPAPPPPARDDGVQSVTALAADAQSRRKTYRVGWLDSDQISAPYQDVVRQAVIGYPQDIAFEYRSADGRADRLRELAAELVRLKVDIV